MTFRVGDKVKLVTDTWNIPKKCVYGVIARVNGPINDPDNYQVDWWKTTNEINVKDWYHMKYELGLYEARAPLKLEDYV